MVCSKRPPPRSSLVLMVLGLGAAAAPAALPGQEVMAVSEEKLAVFAKTYVEIGRVRDEIQAQLANGRNKNAEAQQELRATLKERVERIIADSGLSAEEHKRITYLISVDDGVREAFEKALAQATGTGGAEPRTP